MDGLGRGGTCGEADNDETDEPANKPMLALDVSGTKLAAASVSLKGRIMREESTAMVPTDDGDVLFAQVADLLDRFGPLDRYLGLGVGCGGPMNIGGRHVSPLNMPAWRRFPLLERLRVHSGLPTAIATDAKALALAEGWLGSAAGVDNYIAMVVGTGVGGGIVLNGRLLEGADGNAGDIGHVFVCPESTTADANQVPGLLEAEASGTAIARRIGFPAVDASTAEIRHTGLLVGRAVGSVANLLDLRLALVAGSVALGYGEPFFSSAQAEIDRLCTLDHSHGTRIQPAGLGVEGPLIGATAVGLRFLKRLPRAF